ncbi:thymidine phosphorylase [Frankia sp. AiPs1]|uniref:thymidine phosphorylase n=1 Tax=Frankia sp. AiPs1 TaxID=573493 RepID=UPI0020441866|nr:thymidine phosphorylase [Frankia sp. AiPs1]MCM3923808.1 thymidine phosphorylase [Frankia sp. AiPs1]
MTADFDVVDLIRAKRDGRSLPLAAVDWLIDAYTHGRVADEQMSAYLMAVVWRGMSPPELDRWTAAMIASGERLDLAGVGRPTVDKHSTGGVGDKVSLVLVPLVAACGVAVPQLSGRGLGHTGGTLDKMESIPGWRADLPVERMRRQLAEIGAVICAAGAGLAPADRKLYALRDVTGTVESIPLIASSIMSKKIAEGTSALVLDVKVGSGAFMTSLDDARELARTMVGLGAAAGVRTEAVLTRMDHPLGRTAGNALEVAEAVDTLRGGGPADLVEITVALARVMIELAGAGLEVATGGTPPAHDPAVAPTVRDPAEVLAAGDAYPVWRAMVAAQGGDPDAVLPRATHVETVPAPASGYLASLDARAVGIAAWRLGAGRARKEDSVSATAGVRWRAGIGDRVTAGEPLLELHTDDPGTLGRALAVLAGAVEVTPQPPPPVPLIADHIRS